MLLFLLSNNRLIHDRFSVFRRSYLVKRRTERMCPDLFSFARYEIRFTKYRHVNVFSTSRYEYCELGRHRWTSHF